MIIKSIAHSAYTCKDMAASLHFYCDVLGLTKAFEIPRGDGTPWIQYLKVCDGQFIELFYANADDPDFNKSNISYAHLCLEVADINAACEAIKATGYPMDSEPSQGKSLNWQAWLKDPDGNRIELMQINPASLQANS